MRCLLGRVAVNLNVPPSSGARFGVLATAGAADEAADLVDLGSWTFRAGAALAGCSFDSGAGEGAAEASSALPDDSDGATSFVPALKSSAGRNTTAIVTYVAARLRSPTHNAVSSNVPMCASASLLFPPPPRMY